jgi:glucose-6-phosphate 1-dehydrogenase
MDIAFRFITKKTGLEMDMQPADMVFDYDKSADQSPEAYEMLLLDAMRGDAPCLCVPTRWKKHGM